MRVLGFHINGFGRFADRAVGPLDHPVTVFYGPNEAGKSTYLEFIRSTLFGFPLRGGARHYPPLAGGRHGGSITIAASSLVEDQAKDRYTVRRFQGRGGGPVTITNGGGETIDEAALAKLLGHHSKDVFQNVFAFTLDELHSDDLLKDDKVNSQIYSAGMGAMSLPSAMKSLQSRRDVLFRKGGSSQEVHKVYAELQTIDSKLREVAGNAARYAVLTAKLEQVEADLEGLNDQRRKRQSELDRWRRIENAWDDWHSLVIAEQELRRLPVIERFPVDGVSRLEALDERIGTARQEYNSAHRLLAEANAKAETPIEHEDILSHSHRIRSLERGRTSFDNSVHDLPERQAELEEHRTSLLQALRDIGPDWDEARLDRFDLPITANQEISQFGERLREASELFRAAESNLRQSETAYEETAGHVEHEDILSHSHRIRSLERGRTSFDNSVHDLPERQAELEEHRTSLLQTLRDIGPDWDEARLDRFDLSIAIREEIAQYQERLHEASGELAQREAELAQDQTRLDEALQQEEAAQRDLDSCPEPTLDVEELRERRTLIRTIDSRLRQIQPARERVSVLQDQLDPLTEPTTPDQRNTPGKAIAAIGLLAGIMLGAAGAALGGPALPIGAIAGLALIGIAAYVFMSIRSPHSSNAKSPHVAPIRESFERARADLAESQATLQQDAASLGIETVDETSIIAAQGSLDEDETTLRTWTNLSETLDRARESTERRRSRKEQSREAADAAKERLEAARREWRYWLRARGLRDTFAPNTVVELRSKVDLGLTQLRDLRSWQQRVDAIQEDIDEYMDAVAPLAAAFGVAFDRNDPRTAADAADRLIDLHSEVEQRVRDRTSAETELDNARLRFAESQTQLDAVQSEWKERLRGYGLQDTFTPDTVAKLREQIKTGRSHLANVRSWRQRVGAIQEDINEYIDAVSPLAAAFGVTFDRNEPRTAADAADSLIDLHNEVERKDRDRADADIERENDRRRLEERTNALHEANEERKKLLSSGGAVDGEDFRRRAELHRRRNDLEAKRLAARDHLQRISGPGEPLESLTAELRAVDRQTVDTEIRRLEEERAQADSAIEELSTDRGSIQTERNGLMDEAESSALRVQRNVLLEQIQVRAHEWTKLTIAQNLLEEARRKFEQERQPGVVRHAQKFFADITQGRYRQVYAPLGQQTITVNDSNGFRKDPSQLSRGAREQLFLSLRFGLIRELGQRTEPLPVVVDEVLVNFDRDRAFRAALAFMELSRTNQVLVFTCHPSVVGLFQRAASDAGEEAPNVVEII